jgi:hypothetical protein
MLKSDSQKQAEKFQEKMQEILLATEGPDLIIISLGFISGYQGITMLDYLIKSVVDDPSTPLGKIHANAQKLEGLVSEGVALSPTGALIKILSGEVTPTSTPQENTQQYLDAQWAKIGLGCMGAIIAYAMTRPGFMPALLGMAGNVIKDIAAVPISL